MAAWDGGVFSTIPYMTNRNRQHGSRFMVAAGGLESGLNTAVNAAPLMIAPRLGTGIPIWGWDDRTIEVYTSQYTTNRGEGWEMVGRYLP